MRCLKTEGDMILYLDTSSLVKLYVEEEGSTDVASAVKNASAAATSIIAYAESTAAFARRFREGSLVKRDYKALLRAFENDWANYVHVKVSEEIVRLAGALAEKHGLRGFDAIHLSSAIMLKKSKTPVTFMCYDDKLQKASIRERLAQPRTVSTL